MGEAREAHKVLVGMPKGKIPLGSPRCRWEDGIRMDLREIGWGVCGLDQDRDKWWALMNTAMNLQVLVPRS
jgi:hypothetical protein